MTPPLPQRSVVLPGATIDDLRKAPSCPRSAHRFAATYPAVHRRATDRPVDTALALRPAGRARRHRTRTRRPRHCRHLQPPCHIHP